MHPRKTTALKQPSAATKPLAVRTFAETDVGAWDDYVRTHPRATFFHQTGWKRVLEDTFGYESCYLVAHRDNSIHGVLPLFRCRSIRGNTALYSLPHTVYGGPVGDDAETEQALITAARGLGERVLELRNRYANTLDLPALNGLVTFEKNLPATPEEVYKTFPKKAREAINQSRKRWKLEADFEGDVDDFYDMLAASYKHLGTPVFPKDLFSSMRRRFADDSSILLVRHEGRPVAGVLSVTFNGIMMPLYSGEFHEATRLRANNFKYFRLMERAVELGMRRFDFGRSRLSNQGVVRFKTNQGFEAEALPYQILGVDENATPMDPNQGFFNKARRVWSRLPASVARGLGPRVIRYFP